MNRAASGRRHPGTAGPVVKSNSLCARYDGQRAASGRSLSRTDRDESGAFRIYNVVGIKEIGNQAFILGNADAVDGTAILPDVFVVDLSP